jgi:hypothetical protein
LKHVIPVMAEAMFLRHGGGRVDSTGGTTEWVWLLKLLLPPVARECV